MWPFMRRLEDHTVASIAACFLTWGCSSALPEPGPPPPPPIAVGSSVPASRTVWIKDFSQEEGCNSDNLELVVPFLEGIRITRPATSLKATGYEDSYLSYPGSLSMPLVAWRCGASQW